MLEIGKSNEVKFKVDVNGTSALPTVKFVLEGPDAELSFAANKDGEQWSAQVNVPEGFKPGDYGFRIEVVINNRLFTPIKKRVQIGEVVSASTPVEVTPPAPQLPIKPPTLFAKIAVEEKKVPAIEKPKPKPAPIPQKLFVPPPAPVKEVRKPIKINMADIVAESNKRFEKVLSESPTYRQPVKPARVSHNIKPHTPVTLKKGEVVYE